MAIQILPVQQIGKALSQNQWTEELPHGSDSGCADVHMAKAFLPAMVHTHTCNSTLLKEMIYIHVSQGIPSNHSTDVVTPPPDLLG